MICVFSPSRMGPPVISDVQFPPPVISDVQFPELPFVLSVGYALGVTWLVKILIARRRGR